jgi:hypothetical protein
LWLQWWKNETWPYVLSCVLNLLTPPPLENFEKFFDFFFKTIYFYDFLRSSHAWGMENHLLVP